MRRGTDPTATENVEEVLIFAPAQSIILVTRVIFLEVGLEPLAELEVVQVASLDQLADVNMSLDSILVERVLQDLIVVYELVLVLCAPLDSRKGERVGVERVKHGAVDSTSGALLNLRQLQLYRSREKHECWFDQCDLLKGASSSS